jgi:TetR/AcrR family transcriptional repressor of nem operon
MRNPDATREKILKKSGVLFNTQGYKATSISDITEATGFTKGAIYRHFKSKEELEKETLYHLSMIMFEEVRKFIKAETTAGNKLRSVLKYYETYVTTPAVKGGCPILNAAVEADDAHPELRKGAIKILDILHDSVVTILENGIKYKQLKKGIDVHYYATLIIASLEGAIMMSKLRGETSDIKRVVKHLDQVLTEIELYKF